MIGNNKTEKIMWLISRRPYKAINMSISQVNIMMSTYDPYMYKA